MRAKELKTSRAVVALMILKGIIKPMMRVSVEAAPKAPKIQMQFRHQLQDTDGLRAQLG